MTTTTLTPRPVRVDSPKSGGLLGPLADVWAMTRRNLVHISREPMQLSDVTIQPVLFTFLFVYIFGGAIPIPGGGSYKDYLLAGILALNLVTSVMGTAVGLSTDLHEGMIDRFRALPIWRPAVLMGRSINGFALLLVGYDVLLDRPIKTAGRHMGRARKRSIIPFVQVGRNPTAVPITEVTKVQRQNATKRGSPCRSHQPGDRVAPTKDVHEQESEQHRLDGHVQELHQFTRDGHQVAPGHRPHVGERAEQAARLGAVHPDGHRGQGRRRHQAFAPSSSAARAAAIQRQRRHRKTAHGYRRHRRRHHRPCRPRPRLPRCGRRSK